MKKKQVVIKRCQFLEKPSQNNGLSTTKKEQISISLIFHIKDIFRMLQEEQVKLRN